MSQKKVRTLVFRGHEVERRRMILEGATLFDKERNQRYAIKGRPTLARRPLLAGGSADTYLCSAETATTFDPPGSVSRAAIDEKEYEIGPEFLAELLDNRDLAALNAASKPVPVLLLVLAAGAGMALMVIIQLGFQAWHAKGGA